MRTIWFPCWGATNAGRGARLHELSELANPLSTRLSAIDPVSTQNGRLGENQIHPASSEILLRNKGVAGVVAELMTVSKFRPIAVSIEVA